MIVDQEGPTLQHYSMDITYPMRTQKLYSVRNDDREIELDKIMLQ